MLDSGNRSFLVLVTTGAALYLAITAAACVLLSLLLVRLVSDGFTAFDGTAWVAAPAAAFLGLIGVSGVLGVRSLGAQIAASRRLARRIERLRSRRPTELASASVSVGLGDRLRMVEAPEPFSFTYGALQPRVALSRPLFESASRDELAAVLIHERYHVRNFDPLKVVLARALARALFFLPALKELEARYLAGRELAADRRALTACGHRSLASALLKVVRGPAWPELSTAAAIGGPELLDIRISQLESNHEPRLGGFTRRAVAASAVGVLVLAGTFAAALAGLGGLAAAMGLSDSRMEASGLGIVMALGCAAPGLIAGWLAWRWLSA